jgi:ferritin
MKLDKKIIEALNYRIQQEEASARIYEQFALWLNNAGFKNFAALYYKYAHEELGHAKFAKDHLLAFGIEPELKALPIPSYDFNSLEDILKLTLEHEHEITRQCNELTKLAAALDDFPTMTLGLKYCAEQIEEIDKAQTFVDQIKTFGTSKEVMITLEHNVKDLL